MIDFEEINGKRYVKIQDLGSLYPVPEVVTQSTNFPRPIVITLNGSLIEDYKELKIDELELVTLVEVYTPPILEPDFVNFVTKLASIDLEVKSDGTKITLRGA